MRNPGKMKVYDVDEEKEVVDDEESAMTEIVLGLPRLTISNEEEEDEEEEARQAEQAIAAAKLVMAAMEETVMNEMGEGKNKKKKESSRLRKKKRKTEYEEGEASGSSGKYWTKKKKNAWELANPRKGPPVCKVCGGGFGSWKEVFAHMKKDHKDKYYQGFLPPPTFAAPKEVVRIPGPNSAFVVYVAPGGGGSSGGGGGGGAPVGEGVRGLGIDLNVGFVVEEEDEKETAMFDLNKSPPKDEDEDDKTK